MSNAINLLELEMFLNLFITNVKHSAADRSFNDLTQYPVFPWVVNITYIKLIVIILLI